MAFTSTSPMARSRRPEAAAVAGAGAVLFKQESTGVTSVALRFASAGAIAGLTMSSRDISRATKEATAFQDILSKADAPKQASPLSPRGGSPATAAGAGSPAGGR